MKRYVVLGSVFAMAAAGAGVVACSDSAGTTIQPPYDAGAKPAPTGEPEPEPASDAGDAGDAATPNADGGDAGAKTFALFAGTDFASTELAVVGLNPPSIGGRLQIAGGDAVPFGSGEHGFVLDRKLGKVFVLDKAEPWKSTKTLDINDGPDASSYASNPHAVVVTTGSKAYVARYASNKVKIVDTAAGTVTGDLDLAPYGAAGDPDGLVEVEDGVFDAATNRIYFLLQRIDQYEYPTPAPDHVGKCLAKRGAIVAFDTTTNTAVDLNGPADGKAVDLQSANPGSLTADFAGKRLVVVGSGCYVALDAGADAGIGVGGREGRGVESVDLTQSANGATSWLYTTTETEALSGLLWADATHAFVAKGGTWYAWNPTQTTLGAAATGFPKAPVYDGAGHVLGIAITASDAGADAGPTWSIASWNVATGAVTTLIASDPFVSVRPDPSYGLSSAVIR